MAKSMDELARKTMSKAARDQARQRSRQIMAELLLTELRQAVGPTQKELAQRLGIAQPTLSRLEKQSDMQITTLQRLVEALGGQLQIIARFPKGQVMITQFDEKGHHQPKEIRKLQLI